MFKLDLLHEQFKIITTTGVNPLVSTDTISAVFTAIHTVVAGILFVTQKLTPSIQDFFI